MGARYGIDGARIAETAHCLGDPRSPYRGVSRTAIVEVAGRHPVLVADTGKTAHKTLHLRENVLGFRLSVFAAHLQCAAAPGKPHRIQCGVQLDRRRLVPHLAQQDPPAPLVWLTCLAAPVGMGAQPLLDDPHEVEHSGCRSASGQASYRFVNVVSRGREALIDVRTKWCGIGQGSVTCRRWWGGSRSRDIAIAFAVQGRRGRPSVFRSPGFDPVIVDGMPPHLLSGAGGDCNQRVGGPVPIGIEQTELLKGFDVVQPLRLCGGHPGGGPGV